MTSECTSILPSHRLPLAQFRPLSIIEQSPSRILRDQLPSLLARVFGSHFRSHCVGVRGRIVRVSGEERQGEVE